MAISDLTARQYDAIAKLRAEIVRLLDEAFGNNYVLVVGYWRDPDGPGGWWNKRFGPDESPETIRKFIAVSREAEAQMHHVRNMAEWDAWLLYDQETKLHKKDLVDYTLAVQKQLEATKQEFNTLLGGSRDELTKQLQAKDAEIQELKARLREATRRRRRAGPAPR